MEDHLARRRTIIHVYIQALRPGCSQYGLPNALLGSYQLFAQFRRNGKDVPVVLSGNDKGVPLVDRGYVQKRQNVLVGIYLRAWQTSLCDTTKNTVGVKKGTSLQQSTFPALFGCYKNDLFGRPSKPYVGYIHKLVSFFKVFQFHLLWLQYVLTNLRVWDRGDCPGACEVNSDAHPAEDDGVSPFGKISLDTTVLHL